MGITGADAVSNVDATTLDVAVRTCLTYGVALACDAVFKDGRAALNRIEELTATIGLDDTLLVLKDNIGLIGQLKETAACALDGMDVRTMRMMVFQLHMFRMMQDAKVKALEASH